jgi:hypothetical protein
MLPSSESTDLVERATNTYTGFRDVAVYTISTAALQPRNA